MCGVIEGQPGQRGGGGHTEKRGELSGRRVALTAGVQHRRAGPSYFNDTTFVLGSGCRRCELWNSDTCVALLTSVSGPTLLPCNLTLHSAQFP